MSQSSWLTEKGVLAVNPVGCRAQSIFRGLKAKFKSCWTRQRSTHTGPSHTHISSNAVDLDGEVRQRAEPRQLRPIVVRAARLARVDGHYRPEMARTQPPEMKVGDFVAVTLDRLAKVVRHGTVRIYVQQDSPCVADQAIDDQLAITQAPTIPASGSIQSHPNTRASTRPTITSTDTAASAITWIIAARMLLSRCAAPCACSCSSKMTEWSSSADAHTGVNDAAPEFPRPIPDSRRAPSCELLACPVWPHGLDETRC